MKVMCFGTFDLLHKGHEFLLQEAKRLGELIVVIARDDTVLAVKGKMPRNDVDTRKRNLENLGIAKKVIVGNKSDKYKVIEENHPDIIVLGYDQDAFTDKLKNELTNRGIDAKIIRMESYKPHKYKSSLLSP